MRKNSIKNTRINAEVQKELSNIIRGEIKDPRIHPMTSVMAVEVAPDLKTCKAFISVLGSEESKKSTISGLKSAEGYIRRQLANNRQGTQKAKTRSEVRGGGRKPWRQKGTGHARQGSIRAPQWTGGGVVFAPVPRDYEVKMNKKERRAALKSALTSKVQDNKLVVVDSLALAEVKTKEMQKVLTNLKAEKALVITADNDQNVILSARNIADVETATPATINTYDVMKHNTVVVTKDAVASIEEVYA